MRLGPALLATLVLSGCVVGSNGPQSLEGRKAGDVVFEAKRGRKQGYVEIFRSIVNPPTHWEGVGHFSFVYFKKFEICQCSLNEVVISPKGRYLVFVASGGQLSVFDSQLSRINNLSEAYIGYPISVEWKFSSTPLVVFVAEPSSIQAESRVEFAVTLEPET